MRRAVQILTALILCLFCLLPLFSLAARLPTPMQMALVVYVAAAFMAPLHALLLLAGLGPVAGVLYHDGSVLLEAALLLLLCAAALRRATRTPIALTEFEWASIALAAVVAASWLGQWRITLLRAEMPDASLASHVRLLRLYGDRPVELIPLTQTLQFLEGVGLAALVARVARGRELQLIRVVLVGAAGAAALNVVRFVEVVVRQSIVSTASISALWRVRVSTQYGDVNAAGSYFSMAGVMAAVLTRAAAVPGNVALLVAILAGLWFSGSRVALLAFLICAGLAAGLGFRSTPVKFRAREITAAAVLLLVAAGAIALFVHPSSQRAGLRYSIFTRVELLKAGLRMVSERPLLGVGISRFYDLSRTYGSPELREAFAQVAVVPVIHENAHNNFMQILAELGTFGLAAFAFVLATALRGRASATSPAWRLATQGGLAAFLLTCLAGHPLLTLMVAAPFWLALGIAASDAPAFTGARRTYVRATVVVLVAALLATLPARARYERRVADLEGVSIGFSKWTRDGEGNRYRLAERQSSLFAAATSRFVKIPLRSPDERTRRVQIRLDGRTVSEVLVPAGAWRESRLILPHERDSPKFRRVDLVVVEPEAVDRGVWVGRVTEEAPPN